MGRLMISLELQDQPFLSTISRRPTFCPERRRQGQLGGRPTLAQLSSGIAGVDHTLLFDPLAPPLNLSAPSYILLTIGPFQRTSTRDGQAQHCFCSAVSRSKCLCAEPNAFECRPVELGQDSPCARGETVVGAGNACPSTHGARYAGVLCTDDERVHPSINISP